MSNITLAIIAGAACAVLASFVVWRSSRRHDTTSYLKGASVSRQWLMEHQGEDRS